MKTEQVHVRMEPELRKKARAYTRKNKLTLTRLIEKALKFYMERGR